MTETDLFRFQALLKRVCATFRVRTDNDDFKGMAQSYFDALRKWNFDDLERGADAWMETQTKFPKPIEWRLAIPKPKRELPILSTSEVRDYLHAEANGYEDSPCQCAKCVEAGVSDKPQRFLPEFDNDDREIRVKHPVRDQEVTKGHWGHGWELARFYAARADFYNGYFALFADIESEKKKKRRPFTERLDEIFRKSREEHSDFVQTKELL